MAEVTELLESKAGVSGTSVSEASLELFPLFFGFNTFGPNTLAPAMVVRVRFRPASLEIPVFDQVLVYTQNIEAILFFMIPVPSVRRPFPFTRLREPDAVDFPSRRTGHSHLNSFESYEIPGYRLMVRSRLVIGVCQLRSSVAKNFVQCGRSVG